MKTKVLSLFLVLVSLVGMAQNFPEQWQIDESNHLLTIGGVADEGLFNVNNIDTIYLQFASASWYSQLTSNYQSGTELAATLTYHGVEYSEVGVTFKGQTSYQQVNSQKKSFNIRMDAFVDGQELDGFDVLNLNNCFDDATFMREFIYLSTIREFIPAAKACYVELVVNGSSWGLYPMIEQLDGHYTKEWFLSKDGTRWRADAPAGTGGGGPGGGGGPQWGDGTAALNYLGTTASTYQQYYTLKSSTVDNPWQNLINTADILNNTATANLPSVLPDVLDVDRTLWYLACENVFADDDSYIMKGKMDYYLYWEIETGRMVPLEYDGNSVLEQTTLSWSPFYHADNVNYPLLNKLLAVPEYRQRYLAHMRTIIMEQIDVLLTENTIASWKTILDAHVQNDPKKIYTYNQFVSGATTLHSNLQTRRNNLMNNTEVNQIAPSILNVTMESTSGVWQNPVSNTSVYVTSEATATDGIHHVSLYYSFESVGNFIKIEMLDNGNFNDGAAGDGVYGAEIPGATAGTLVRFYVEAIRNNIARTAAYSPIGAEHDVYYYRVNPAWADAADIVINEVMADNQFTAFDEVGDSDDWIELYNRGNEAIDLTNYFITDNDWNLTKWEIPAGTILNADEYLILWADEESAEGTMHANFKLLTSGETITLINSNFEIADQLVFAEQNEDVGLARVPNGTGPFVQQAPTFNANNVTTIAVSELSRESISIFPNPCADVLYLRSTDGIASVEILDMNGRVIDRQYASTAVNTSGLSSGVYVVRVVTKKNIETNMRLIKR